MNNRSISNKVNNAANVLIEQLQLNPNIVYQNNDEGIKEMHRIIGELEEIMYAFDMAAEMDEM